jgi:LPXTG-motif cell wall-anchored protein
MVITVGDKTLVEGTDFEFVETKNEDGTTDLKIVFKNFLQYNTDEFIGKPVVVSYTAQLNKDAEVNKTPNTNDVYLNYSNDPTVDYNGENEPNEEDENKPPMGETPIDRTETYTTTLEIVKTDPIGNRLEGAEFTLTGTSMNVVRMEKDVFTKDDNGDYWKLTDGSFTTTDPNSNIAGAPVDQSKYDSLTIKYAKQTQVDYITTEGENKTVTGTVSSDGTLRFEGLGAGEFTITEIKAPDGYNMLTEELKVTITWNEETKLFEYTGATDENGVARVTIINQAGTELPSTGGTGTTIFYLAGGILVLAAVVLLVSKKRMSAQA